MRTAEQTKEEFPMNENIKAIAIRICDLREIMGYTQQEVAERSATSCWV